MEGRMRAVLDVAPFFADLPPSVREALGPSALRRSISRKEKIFCQGEPARHFFLVWTGKIRLVHAGEDGAAVVIRFCSTGEIFGGISLVDEARYPVTAEALEAGEVLLWPRDKILAVAAAHPELALATTGVIAARMKELQERFREVSTQRVDRRLARAVRRLAQQVGRPTEDSVIIDLPLSRLDLAEMTGTTLFTVSRILSAWQEQGIVRVGRERVEVVSLEKLIKLGD